MKLRKLFAALRDPARDPADGGQGGGSGASTNPSATATPAQPNGQGDTRAAALADLSARNTAIRAALEPHMSRPGVQAIYIRALENPQATAESVHAEVLVHLGQGTESVAGRSGRIDMGEEESEKLRNAGSQFILARANLLPADQVAQARQGNPFNGMTLMDMARDFAERGGASVRGMGRDGLIQAALSTDDFPNLLENTLHKAIIGAYARQRITWTRFCATGSLSDFRPHVRLYLGGFSDLKEVGENGEFEAGDLSDADKETITGKSKGRILNLSREMLINDDMGFFARAAVMLGQGAARTLEKDVYAVLAQNGGKGPTMSDGKPLFDATHNNIDATGAAPGTASFDAARILMGKQTDPSGELLDIAPAIWLGPSSIGGQARTVNEAQYDTDAGTKTQTPNRSRGLYTDIVDTARLPGTRWYSFADPALEPVLEVGFVDGIDQPQIMSRQKFESAGLSWRVLFDYGVGAVSFRGAATNAGA